MTRAELIERISRMGRMSRSRAEMLVEAIFGSLVESLRRGEKIEVRGFGTFQVRHYQPYAGRNPRTGQAVGVKAKRLPYFKVGKELANRVNAGREDKNRAAGISSALAPEAVFKTTEVGLSE